MSLKFISSKMKPVTNEAQTQNFVRRLLNLPIGLGSLFPFTQKNPGSQSPVGAVRFDEPQYFPKEQVKQSASDIPNSMSLYVEFGQAIGSSVPSGQ